MILPTIAPIAVLLSVGEPAADVGPVEAELEVAEDCVDDPDPDEGTIEEITDREEVSDGVSDVGDKVEEGSVVGVEVEEGGVVGVGVIFVELGVGDTGGNSVVLGGVGPP